MAFWLIRSSSELKYLCYHINRVGIRIGPAFAFCSHHLTAHVGPLYERAEADRLFLLMGENCQEWLYKGERQSLNCCGPDQSMLASYRVHEISSAKANVGPVSLAHKGLPLPHCMQDILPPNQRKNFSYLALLAMQHYRLAFQNSFSVWTT